MHHNDKRLSLRIQFEFNIVEKLEYVLQLPPTEYMLRH